MRIVCFCTQKMNSFLILLNNILKNFKSSAKISKNYRMMSQPHVMLTELINKIWKVIMVCSFILGLNWMSSNGTYWLLVVPLHKNSVTTNPPWNPYLSTVCPHNKHKMQLCCILVVCTNPRAWFRTSNTTTVLAVTAMGFMSTITNEQ